MPSTIFRELTPAGRAAVACVEVEGPQAADVIRRWFRARTKAKSATIQLGDWQDSSGPAEELVIVRLSDDRFEVQCHGGSQAVQRVVDCLVDSGCCQRTVEVKPVNIDDAVNVELQRALTPSGVHLLVDQLGGQLHEEIESIVERIQCGDISEAITRLNGLLGTWHYGEHIGRAFQVAIAGRPNAGKSSLLNRLAGYDRAIVFDQPGTTRDALVLDTAVNGWPVAFVDTAGLRATDDQVEREGVAIAERRMQQADLLIWVADGTSPWSEAGPSDTELPLDLKSRMVFAYNKCDLAKFDDTQGPKGIPVSCLTGDGLGELKKAISERLTPEPPQPGDAVVFLATWSRVISTCIAQLNDGNSKAAIDCLTQESSWFRR